MKKLKELLCFIAAFAVLVGVAVVCFFAFPPFVSSPFFGPLQYIRLMTKDPLFWKTAFNTFTLPVLFSLVAAGIFSFLVWLFRHKIKIARSIYYIAVALLVSLTIVLFVGFISRSVVAVALLIGWLTAFVCWLAEMIIGRIKCEK